MAREVTVTFTKVTVTFVTHLLTITTKQMSCWNLKKTQDLIMVQGLR
jgi:hypothetical protein